MNGGNFPSIKFITRVCSILLEWFLCILAVIPAPEANPKHLTYLRCSYIERCTELVDIIWRNPRCELAAVLPIVSHTRHAFACSNEIYLNVNDISVPSYPTHTHIFGMEDSVNSLATTQNIDTSHNDTAPVTARIHWPRSTAVAAFQIEN